MSIRIFAVTNRGLEHISAKEMQRLPGLQVNKVSYRRITATYSGDLARLSELRSVDDVFFDLAAWEDIVPQRSSLEILKERSKHLDMNAAIEAISRIRSISKTPPFSVTVNFVGKRNYNTDEIKRAVVEGIIAKYHWKYATEDLSEVNIRVFIEHHQAYVGMRIGDKALHRRSYKHSHVPGSLKPSVAAAMLQMAEIKPGQRVVDPFCGAGTILVEAAWLGLQALGGDNDPNALFAAKTNAASAGVHIQVQCWDAQNLPIASHSVERVVTNLPWGRQVNAEENMIPFYRNICRELIRVLKKDGKIVLLTNLPQLVQLGGFTIKAEIEISLFGLTPTIMEFTASL